ncbi:MULTISPECIES: ABC transporter ATP-binding protein [Haloferax]|uniref:Branched chain amino acid ABC transporter ATP-binding protein n=1 Tax=Haloferax denitrificans ATCC 35960 TaxID=662478 RepID=M0JG90_9EURY|nr:MULTISPECIES: ATP-binding cassette domain-containing protein [Haloferax]EMA07991.1 branched chain amino acid ABC transporter ATP-binding protein [Haloferax denitrificans ATCC 35960]
MSNRAPLLETNDLRKTFDSVVAADDVDIEFYSDEIVGVIGPNGAGKTTFINLVSGALSPTSGQITFKGEDISELADYKRVKEGIARSFQLPHLYDDLTIIENVKAALVSRDGKTSDFVRPLSRDEAVHEEALDVLETFGLTNMREMKAENLPHGKRKILDIAMSFALEPDLLLLDEPTSGVGSEEKENVMDIATNAARETGTSLIFVEHDMQLVLDYSDRVVALHNGRILTEGEPEAVLNSDEVLEHIREEGA